MSSEIRFEYDDVDLNVGDELRVRVMWYGEPLLDNGVAVGFAAFGLSYGWNASVLRFVNRYSRDAAPHMSQFFPKEGQVYKINQREVGGELVNDGDAQLICFGRLQRGGTSGDPALCPSRDGTLLTTLVFEVIGNGDSRLKWLDLEGESSSLTDNCVIFGNTRPNWKYPNVTWTDNVVTVGDTAVEPPDDGRTPAQTAQESAIEALVAWLENNEASPVLVQLVMQLIWAFSEDSSG